MLKFIVSRPIAVCMTALGLVAIGAFILPSIPISLLPDIPIPRIVVQINYSGHSAREIENAAIRPLRQALMQVRHLENIESRTRNGNAIITLEYLYGTNPDLAFIELNEKIDQAMSSLPRDMPRPIAIRGTASDLPVVYLNIMPKPHLQREIDIELSEWSRTVLKRRLEQLPEIAFADRSGYLTPQLTIVVHRELLHSLQINDADIAMAFREQNAYLGNFILRDGQYEFPVELSSELKTVEDVQNIVIQVGSRIFKLGELASVRIDPEQLRGIHFYNGRDAIVMTLRKQGSVQLFTLQKSLNKLLAELRATYPDLDFALSNDQTRLLHVSMENLRTSLLYGIGFAVIILLLFYRHITPSLIIAISIPVSLLIVATGFYLLNISINVISIAGVIMGVGLMIDNAIIIIDTIRQKQSSSNITSACVDGANEVIRPLIASTLTTCSVFVPLVFLSGLTGALFTDQALSLVIALSASLLVAYFLLPTLYRIAKPRKERVAAQSIYQAFQKTIDSWLNHKIMAFTLIFIVAGVSWVMFPRIEKTSFPPLSQQGIRLDIDWNTAIPLSENSLRAKHIVKHVDYGLQASNIFVGEGQFMLDEEQRDYQEASVILYFIRPELLDTVSDCIRTYIHEKYPTATFEIRPLDNLFERIFGSRSATLVAHVQSTRSESLGSWQDIKEIQEALLKKEIRVDMPPRNREIHLWVLRERALLFNVNLKVIYDRLKTLFSQNQIDILKSSSQYIPVKLGSKDMPIETLIAGASVSNQKGVVIPLSELIERNMTEDYRTIIGGRTGENVQFKFDYYSVDLVQTIREVIDGFASFNVHFSGTYFRDTAILKELRWVALVSICILYLILVAQFESLLQPFIVMCIVPFAMCGSIWLLWAAGQSINLLSVIGVIVMAGIDVNDSILKIDLINKARKSGMAVRDAIHESGRRRIRPIFLTSLTTILALTPVLFVEGLGAELQQPLAYAVIGGLFFGTLGSIYIVPLLYEFLIPGSKI